MDMIAITFDTARSSLMIGTEFTGGTSTMYDYQGIDSERQRKRRLGARAPLTAISTDGANEARLKRRSESHAFVRDFQGSRTP
jgi:hypothetical protein